MLSALLSVLFDAAELSVPEENLLKILEAGSLLSVDWFVEELCLFVG
jgi:hypothetical protein